NVNCLYAGRVSEFANIEDKLMSAASIVVGIQDWVMWSQASENVVCVEKCDFGRICEPSAAHHLDIGPTDWKNACTAPRCAADWWNRLSATNVCEGMPREIGCKMLSDADWTYSRPSTAMWDAEGLVEIQMTYVCTYFAG